MAAFDALLLARVAVASDSVLVHADCFWFKWPDSYQRLYASAAMLNLEIFELHSVCGSTPQGLENLSANLESLIGLHVIHQPARPIPTAISLLSKLHGPLPPSIGLLSYLEVINIAQNAFSGRVPKEIGNLIHLRSAFLDRNQFSGSIPDSISNLRNLEILILNQNMFIGEIPIGLYSLTSLRSVYLSDNRLSGQIIPDIGRLRHLRKLTIERNFFTGPLPNEIIHCTSLEKLNIFPNPGLIYKFPPAVNANPGANVYALLKKNGFSAMGGVLNPLAL
ncbi:UNVERIFIED_CONTAM: hypothetical protein HDU68_003828 [Siphonaria sp. JEL0065]|nr:hypothetical protein HDU68_003828 [Siphonaria sp. JEL0065]